MEINENNFLEYWDNIYSKEFYFGSGPTKLAKLALDIISKDVKTILEIGCGQGRDAMYFSHLGFKVDAFDISHKAIESLLKKRDEMKLENLNAYVHDVKEPIPDSHGYDFVYSNLALQFFDLSSLDKIFSNISKVLKNKSYFLFSTKKEGDKYYKHGNKVNDFAYESNGVIRYFYDKDALIPILQKHYEIVFFESDSHKNLDDTVSVWWKVLLKKK